MSVMQRCHRRNPAQLRRRGVRGRAMIIRAATAARGICVGGFQTGVELSERPAGAAGVPWP